jgi:hypothetical protein
MKKIGEIAPWSFYRNDNGPDIIETSDTKESELSNLRKQLG